MRREQLAAKLGLAAITIAKWELLRELPTVQGLILWADALGLRLVLSDPSGLRVQEGRRHGGLRPDDVICILMSLLAAERDRAGVTRHQVAGHVGVSTATVHRWEHNAAGIRARSLLAWAECLGYTVQLEANDPAWSCASRPARRAYHLADQARGAPLVTTLTKARYDRPLTQKELGARLGVTASAVRDWEGIRDLPAMHNFILWIDALGFRLVLVSPSGGRLRAQRPQGRSLPQQVVTDLIGHLVTERNRRLITQLGLSARLGVTQQTMNRWERCSAGIRPLHLLSWADCLGHKVELEKLM